MSEALKRPDASMQMAVAHQDRGTRWRRLIPAHELFAGFDQAEGFGGFDAQRLEHFGGEHLAQAAVQREAAVAFARPGRLAASLGSKVQKAARFSIAHLREEKAAAVTEIGIVDAELMAVVAQRQGVREIFRQRREPAKMVHPFIVGQSVQADAPRPSLIAIAQAVKGKIRRLDGIVKLISQALM